MGESHCAHATCPYLTLVREVNAALGFLRVGERSRGWKETLRWELPACRVRGGARERVSHPEEVCSKVSQSGSFLCSSVGGVGGVRYADESRSDGSCGDGSRGVWVCVDQREMERATLYGWGLKGESRSSTGDGLLVRGRQAKTKFLDRSLKGSSGSSGNRRDGTTHTRPSVSALFSSLLFPGTFL
jgi:hypothetical protein